MFLRESGVSDVDKCESVEKPVGSPSKNGKAWFKRGNVWTGQKPKVVASMRRHNKPPAGNSVRSAVANRYQAWPVTAIKAVAECKLEWL